MPDFDTFKELCEGIKILFSTCSSSDNGDSCLQTVKKQKEIIIYLLIFFIVFIFPYVFKVVKKHLSNKQQHKKAENQRIIENVLKIVIDLYQVAYFCVSDLEKNIDVSSKLWVKSSRKSESIKNTRYRSIENPFNDIEKMGSNYSDLIEQGKKINNDLINFRQQLEKNDTKITYSHVKEADKISKAAKGLINKIFTENELADHKGIELKKKVDSIESAKFPSSIRWYKCLFHSKYKHSEQYYEPDTQSEDPDNE